jgi:hypothetical protein
MSRSYSDESRPALASVPHHKKSGLLPDTGGIKGTDYEEYQSTKKAAGSNGLLPSLLRHYGRDGNLRKCTNSLITELIDAGNDGKTTFISNVKGGNSIQSGAHKGKVGYVVQFSPFLFARSGGEAEPAKYQYFSGWRSSNHNCR